MKKLRHHLSQVLPALVALGLAAFVLRSVDLERVLGLVASLGWWLPLLLLPNLAVTLIEGLGWWLSFESLGTRPRYAALVRVRLAVEAVMLGLPSGAVISESLQPYLLRRRCGVPFETGVVASVARKFFVVVSHGLVLGGATLLAWRLVERTSRATIGQRGLPWLLLGAAAFMIGTFGVGLVLGARAQLGDRVRRGLHHIGGRWLGPWLERHALRFQRADEQFVGFFERDPPALLIPMLLYMLGWVVRGVETFLYLRLLGVEVPLVTATVIETGLVLVRSMAVPLPAGLGVQDVGYVLALRALGLADAATVGTAFVLLKRGKDLFWILVGFLLVGAGKEGPAPASHGRAEDLPRP